MNSLSISKCLNVVRNFVILIPLILGLLSCKSQTENKSVYYNLKEALEDAQKVQRLDLTATNLDSFPTEIRNFKNLVYLNLSRNKIKTIPPWLSELKNLRNIDLSTLAS